MNSNKLFLRVCKKQSVERAPVWMMRQAGRYLPEYRALRQKHNFTTMYKTPELAAEVTMQPLRRLEVDAAILFSDILVIPEACGLPLEFQEDKGPVFARRVLTQADVHSCRENFAVEKLDYVFKTLEILKKELPADKTLIGFAGAPWTVATYMIEGGSSKKFHDCKMMRYTNPRLLHELMQFLSKATIAYCQKQIASGAEVIQLFDTWAGILDEEGFHEFALSYVRQIIEALKPFNVPVIYFAKSAGAWIHSLPQSKADVLGLDWTLSFKSARHLLGHDIIFQGNLDPSALYSDETTLKKLIGQIIAENGSNSRHIMNLGHGIFPDVEIDKAKLFIDYTHEESFRVYNQY